MRSHSLSLFIFPRLILIPYLQLNACFPGSVLLLLRIHGNWKKHSSFFPQFFIPRLFFHFQQPCTAQTPHKTHFLASVSIQSCIFLWVNLQVLCVAVTLAVWKVMERRKAWTHYCFTIISAGRSAQSKYLSKITPVKVLSTILTEYKSI